jgi:glycosyltransferase involved in cell wall biosynthesis
MLYLTGFILVFTALQFIVAATNLIFRQNLQEIHLNGNPLVSILIPARNEEQNIGVILNDLMNQQYANLEILVFDDQSDDMTGKIVCDMGEKDSRIKLIRSQGLPAGWLGKNFACHSLSNHANGDYLLFLDADVRIGKTIIQSAAGYAGQNNLGLLSIFPKQIVISSGEKMTVPVMNNILLTLLPLPLVLGLQFPSLSAANGQFMLFKTEIYRNWYPHEYVKKSKAEDIGIARYYKTKRIRIACLTGNESIQCRMYKSFDEAVKGFSKNITAFFGNSFLLATLFWMITTFGFIPVILFCAANISIPYFVILLVTRILVSKASHQEVLDGFIYFIPQQLAMGLFIFRAFTNKYFYHYQWKGRNIA